MPFQERAETSSVFSVLGVRERMKEKKNGALKTAKINASLAAKIRTKTINNSSIIKVSLKQNNKALALALNAAKIAAHRLTDDKMLLQKEVEWCHFENACLRRKLSSVNKYIEELHQFMNSRLETAMKLSRASENGSCSLLLADGRLSETDDRQDDDDNRPIRPAPMSMRIPLSHVDDKENENGGGMTIHISTGLQTLPSSTTAPAFGKPQRNVPAPALKTTSSSNLIEELSSNEKNGQTLSKVDGVVSAFDLGTIFKDNRSSVSQSSKSCLLLASNNNSPVQQLKETTRPCSDSTLLDDYVTKRKKRRTDSSTASTNDNSHIPNDLSDNVLLGDLQRTKETEPAAREKLEISQIGELVTLKAKNKSYGKIKANEAKALKKVCTETKKGDSSRQSKHNLDHYSNGGTVTNAPNLFETKELDIIGTKAPESTCHTGDSTQVATLEEIMPLNSSGRIKKRGSQYFTKTTGRRTYVMGLAPPNSGDDFKPLIQEIKRETFLEKVKNLESQFYNPESSSLHDKTQPDEKSHGCNVKRTSRCFDKSRGCRRTYVVDPAPQGHMNDCAPFPQEIKKNTHLKNLEDLGSHFQSPGSHSLSSKAPLDACSTQQFVRYEKDIPNQHILALNVKYKEKKKMTQEMNASPEITEADAQSLKGNTSQPQPRKRKTKKDSKDKITKVGRDNAQREHFEIDIDDLRKIAPKVNKRGEKDLTGKSNQANPYVIGNPQSRLPVSLNDEDICLDSAYRNSTTIVQKVQVSSATQNSLNKTNVSSGKAHWGVNSHVTGLKKQEYSKPKLNRKTYTVRGDDGAASELALQNAEESETSQARWSFLCVSGTRTQHVPFLMDVVETPPLADGALRPSTPDLSSAGHSKTALSVSHSSGNSCLVLQTAKDLVISEGCSALLQNLAGFNKNITEQVASSRYKKKREETAPEMLLPNSTLQANENNVLKDLTNACPDSCDSIPLAESPTRPSRRRKKSVCYAEPSLNRKLRRGDPFTITDFLSSPVQKNKREKSRKTKKIKKEKKIEKDKEPSSDFIPVNFVL